MQVCIISRGYRMTGVNEETGFHVQFTYLTVTVIKPFRSQYQELK